MKKTLHASPFIDLILAGITQLITVVLADKINHHEYIRIQTVKILPLFSSIGLTNLMAVSLWLI